MRDGEGVYIGDHECVHWLGAAKYGERVCCGGKKYKFGFAQCAVKGVVVAEPDCSTTGCDILERRDV